MGPGRSKRPLVTALAALALAWGCTTAGPGPAVPNPLDGAASLQRPLPGDMAALYRMATSRGGGLRVAVTTRNRTGRIVLSRQFGGTVMIAAWNPPVVRLLDLHAGCERDPARAARILGLGSLPLSTVPLLLGGRLPAGRLAEDPADSGWVALAAPGWRCRVRLAPEPWRVVALEIPDGTRLTFSSHTASVPGRVRITRPDGTWFTLELVRLEWDTHAALPPLPDLPPCRAGAPGTAG